MAIFEKQVTNKIQLDDTDKLICIIENANNINKHTEYSIRIQRGSLKDNTWCISRRYNDFTSLNAALQPAGITLPLPPKKIIGNMQPGFIAERQSALQTYLDFILKTTILANSLPVKIFLDPDNYSPVLNEVALQNVSMALRGDRGFGLKSPLSSIGWRIRKHYFLVSKFNTNEDNYIMHWQTYGPDKTIPEKDMQILFKSLMNLQHPYIDKIEFLHSLETGAYVIRKIHTCGSVRDQLYGSQYFNPYLAKYANPKQRKPFTMGQVAHYGYQILQALKYLHEKGLPYGHLHPGNITVENQRVLLMDIENCILGVPSYYREFILQHKKINTLELVDVYCFGHTIYEMSYGERLDQSTCESFPGSISNELISLLQMILSPSACKHGLPDIESLTKHTFFSTQSLNYEGPDNHSTSYHLKFSDHMKVQLNNITNCVESRLKCDQKIVRQERKQVRIQEILSSEEEMRRRKRKAKNKENALSKSQSSLNGCIQNGLSPSSLSGPSDRSVSVASTLSTTSSPTPPPIPEEPSAPSTSGSSTNQNRSDLFNSICSFNKSALNKINKK